LVGVARHAGDVSLERATLAVDDVVELLADLASTSLSS